MHRLIALLACTIAAILPNLAQAKDETAMTTVSQSEQANPFFQKSDLPFQFPPFARIRTEHYLPAFERGMAQQQQEIEAITTNENPPTFDNTIIALERSGAILGRVTRVFMNLVGANTSDEMQAIQREIAPKLSAHHDRMMLNDALFVRIKTLYERRDQLKLDPESLRLLERYHTEFKRSGALLSASDKKTLEGINGRLAQLSTQFSQNVLKDTNAAALVLDDKKSLAGLSDNAIAAAGEAAKARGLEGKYVLALSNTTGQAPEENLLDRDLRKRLYQASIERGSHGGDFDNRKLIQEMVRLRAQRARLLGYANHAAYVLEDETAQSVDAVNALLNKLAPPAVANARQEAAQLQQIIDAEHGGFPLAAYDWDMYSEKLRKKKYDLDIAKIRPYFEINHVQQDGVFYAAEKLYGLSFKERKDLPLYHSDVHVFEVSDAEGKPLALFVSDMYARSNKRGGAWMNSYVGQSELDGTLPVVANHLNIPKPPNGEPTLLTSDEVRTMFHEFGHALHGMFSKVKYPRFSGTSVPRDFVEYPSQVNEMWAAWPDVLQHYARHYQTGEALPKELIEKMSAARKFNQGFMTSEYLAAAMLDQSWHQLTPEQVPDDVLTFEDQALQSAGMKFDPVPPRYRSSYFSHIFAGGYSAGYYAYIWSEQLDADTVEWFKENGGLQRKNGDWFRAQLLSKGGSVDAMTLFRQFRGRDPQIGPLLERRGLQPIVDKK